MVHNSGRKTQQIQSSLIAFSAIFYYFFYSKLNVSNIFQNEKN
jgi:hypothetical protein